MKRFTVSLPDDLYAALRQRGEDLVPAATLQQMVRHAVDSLLAAPVPSEVQPDEPTATGDEEKPPEARSLEGIDLLVFAVGDVTYGIPIEMVETVAARLVIRPIPTTSGTLVGVAGFREELTEVHDGGTILQGRPLGREDFGSLLAVPRTTGRVLITVSSVAGLSPATEAKWAAPPLSSPPWVSALAWNDERVVTVIDPIAFNL
jgi:chemotaxis signal transduction protein